MRIFAIYIFPAFLTLGALYLIAAEFTSYSRFEKLNLKSSKLKTRMIRRISGALIVIVVAIMISWGISNMPRPPKALFQHQIRYWSLYWTILAGIVLVAIILAIWDAIDGVRYLERLADQCTLEHLNEINKKLTEKKSTGDGETA